MYSDKLAQVLRGLGIETATVAELGLAARPDSDVFATAREHGHVVVTENVGDFARLSADHLTTGRHHPGILVALSARFSRRPAGYDALASAIAAVADDQLDDRLVYLERPATE